MTHTPRQPPRPQALADPPPPAPRGQSLPADTANAARMHNSQVLLSPGHSPPTKGH